MSRSRPFRPLPIILLSLTLSACVSTNEQPAPAPAQTTAAAEAKQARDAWLSQRDQAIQTLRLNPHLSVTELQSGEALIQIRSGDIFRTATVTVSPAVQPVLEHIATTLAAHPELAVKVVGHTDNVGQAQRNLDLSVRRAEIVRDELITYGLDAERIRSEGRGDSEPIASNDSREGRAVNRRIDLLIDAYPGDTQDDAGDTQQDENGTAETPAAQ